MENTTKGTRLRLLRESKNITLDEAGRAIKKTRQTVFKYEHDIITNIPSDIIIELANLYGSTPAYIMGWDEANKETKSLPPYDNIIPIKKKSFPVIGTIAAGTPIDAEQNIETYVPEDEDLDADYALRVKGDSMIGAGIDDGDIVFIREQPDVENGEMAAVYVDGGATLKRVYKDGKGVSLYSENPKYPPMYFTAENCEEFRVLGKAVKKLTDIK